MMKRTSNAIDSLYRVSFDSNKATHQRQRLPGLCSGLDQSALIQAKNTGLEENFRNTTALRLHHQHLFHTEERCAEFSMIAL